MNWLRLPGILMIFTLFLFTGCGSGGGNMNGNLTVSVGSTDNGNNSSGVTFGIQYANSQASDYQGLDVAVTTTVNGSVIDNKTYVFSSSGILSITYPAIAAGDTIALQAKVGDIVSAKSLTVALSALSVVPTTVTFPAGTAAGTQANALILGGAAPYGFTNSTPTDIGVQISGNNLILTLINPGNASKTATVTVVDSANKTAPVTITY